MMPHFTHEFSIETHGQRLYLITPAIAAWVAERNIHTGLLTVFIRHTSASLAIQENADPDVVRDINEFFRHLVKENAPFYRHASEGPDDMPAHIRAVLTATSLSIPIVDGRMTLGTWQGIYVFEHRVHPHRRSVVLHLTGEAR